MQKSTSKCKAYLLTPAFLQATDLTPGLLQATD